MHKSFTLFLVLALMLSLLSGCGAAKQKPVTETVSKTAATEISPAASDGTQTVHSVDELISAIAPGAQILLAEGEYHLAQAASYGQRTGNPYVKWEDIYGAGYALLIHDVDNLTIQGSGKDSTRIIAQCPEADVLKFEDCVSIHMQDFTAGHTPQSDGCSAGVIHLFRSGDVYFDGLGLFGCGSVGIDADRSDAITVTNCDVYDCSHAGITLSQCKSAIISTSHFYNIGKNINGFNYGYCVFGIHASDMVQIDGCDIENNITEYFLSTSDTQGLHLAGNRITGNSASQGMFLLFNSDTTIDSNNMFEGNSFSRWYAKSWDDMKSQYAVNERRENIFTEDPEPMHSSSEPVEVTPVITGQQKQVKAATVDEFLAAVDSNTEVILTAPLYDLSTAADYGKPGNALHYTWEEVFDGWQLNIMGVENFSIVGTEGKESHTISAVPRYADVISFISCTNTIVKGVTAGHTEEPSVCAGGVLNYVSCTNAAVDACNLYGCGIYGVEADQTENLQIVNSNIYDCSYGGMMCMRTTNLTVGGCTFWDLGGVTFQLQNCSGVVIDGKEVNGNYFGN